MTKKPIWLFTAITLMVVGVVLIGYPLYLLAEDNLEQRRLDKLFADFADEPYIDTDNDVDYIREPIWSDHEPFDLPEWTSFPPTKMEIPAIDLDVHVVAVADMSIFARRLNQAPSYYPQSVFPGEVGNALVAGHRDGPAPHFKYLNKLEPGDIIILHAPGVSYYYEVEKVFIVEPTEISVIAPLDYAALTLTTCQRVGTNTSARRLIVRAKFKEALLN